MLASWAPHPEWERLKRDCRLKPIPAVLREAIQLMLPTRRYHDRLLISDAEGALDSARRYHGNLNKLMSLLHDLFNEEFITLNALDEWLAICIATDTEENEAERPDLGDREGVICMTVHKAKGLEFTTVVLPLTDRTFHARGEQLVVDEDETGKVRIGWLLPRKKDQRDDKAPAPMKNSHYSTLFRGDQKESTREETRLLYVALTRVKRHLIIAQHKPSRPKKVPGTWGELLGEVS